MRSHNTTSTPEATTAVQPARSTWGGWLAVFAAALLLYALTASRGIQWADSGSFILRVVTGDLYGPLGLALSHPLHHWLGRLAVAPAVLEPCMAVTLVSAVAAAVAVANVYGCVLTVTGNRPASYLAAASLGLAHTFWGIATITETYSLVAALLSAECWCLARHVLTGRRSFLWATLLFNGLGIANHLLASLTTPILFVVVGLAYRKRQLSARGVWVALLIWVVGSLPYSTLVAATWIRTGDFAGTLRSALFGASFADNVLNTSISARMLLIVIAFVALSFPNLLLPAAVYGLTGARRLALPVVLRRALVAGLTIHVLFVVRYNVVDQYTFLVPTYVFLSLFGGIGFATALRGTGERMRRSVSIIALLALACTPVVYAAAPHVARRFDVLRGVEYHKPYRDDYFYAFTPWSIGETSADQISREAVALAGETGVIIIEDRMAKFAVQYRLLREGRDQVRLVEGATGNGLTGFLRNRKVVLVPLDRRGPRIAPPSRDWTWKRVGDLYVLDPAATTP